MTDYCAARAAMVARQIVARGISDPRLLDAMRSVPRELFVPDHLAVAAYDDRALPIEEGQTISQPYIVALMIEAAAIGPDDRVLEVGAGSGYAAAVLGRVAAQVFTIERHPALAALARARLEALGADNVTVITGDGTEGLPQEAPFDAILAAASGAKVPAPLKRQLAIGGRLVMPVGATRFMQHLVKLTRRGEDEYAEQNLGAVRFVPLIGVHGFSETAGRSG